MLWITLAACRPDHPLTEVPIEGGTEDQQELVRQTLLELEDSIGPGRVELRRIDIRPLEGRAGSYHAGTRTIELGERQDLPDILRHEVCHALGHQQDLV
jgi:hypothetical protein